MTTLTSVIIIPKFVNKYKVSFHILPKLRGPPIKYLVMENQSAGKLSVGKLQQLFFALRVTFHNITTVSLSSHYPVLCKEATIESVQQQMNDASVVKSGASRDQTIRINSGGSGLTLFYELRFFKAYRKNFRSISL